MRNGFGANETPIRLGWNDVVWEPTGLANVLKAVATPACPELGSWLTSGSRPLPDIQLMHERAYKRT